MNDSIEVHRIYEIVRSIENLNYKCERNMRALNDMMLEMKGIIAMVRPKVKNNDRYKDELKGTIVKDNPSVCIEFIEEK